MILPEIVTTLDGQHKEAIFRNVRRCPFGRGPVDRICQPDPQQGRDGPEYTTICFRCRECGRMGDPFIGMIDP